VIPIVARIHPAKSFSAHKFCKTFLDSAMGDVNGRDQLDPGEASLQGASGIAYTSRTPQKEHNSLGTFTDHMLSVKWTAAEGWLTPKIGPYHNLSLDPATCSLHYSFQVFESLKAYKDKHGHVLLFRPDKNMIRLNAGAANIALPTFDCDVMIELLKSFVKLEQSSILP
jgi:hypothetical protein